MATAMHSKLPQDVVIAIGGGEEGRKPFLLEFLERLPSSTELGQKIGARMGSTLRSTAANDALDIDDDG